MVHFFLTKAEALGIHLSEERWGMPMTGELCILKGKNISVGETPDLLKAARLQRQPRGGLAYLCPLRFAIPKTSNTDLNICYDLLGPSSKSSFRNRILGFNYAAAVEYSLRARKGPWLGAHNLDTEVDPPSNPF